MLEVLLGFVSLWNVAGVVAVAAAVLYAAKAIEQDQKIRRLAGYAPKRAVWLPFGLDVAYNGARSTIEHRVLEYFNEGFEKYANPNRPYTIEFSVAGQRIVVTKDEENIKAILATQFQDYGKGEKFNQDWHAFLGDSIFTTDGDQWHDSRQLIRPQFIKDRLSDIKIFERHVSILTPLLVGTPAARTVDVMDLFFRFTLDASTDFLLGRSADSLRQPKIAFIEAFNFVQHYQSIIARVGDFNFLLPRGKFNKQLDTMNRFVEPYIEQALLLSQEELEKRTKSDEGYTFLHALAAFTRDRKVLRDQLVAVLLAGRDTTACTLTWLFYELSSKPEMVKKLRAEILDYVGPTASPTYDNLKSMKYLQHCLNETLRLYPIVPFNVRLALKDTTLPHGGGPDGLQPVGVLKGTPIGYSTLAMQRREDIYPDPSTGFPPVDQFEPERWFKWTPRSWTYVPFNGGPRICIGQQFALTEMAYTITRIFQKYERIENRMPAKPKFRADIVLQPASPVLLDFYEVGSEKT